MYISSELVSTAAIRFREHDLMRTLERRRMIGELIEEERLAVEAAGVGAAEVRSQIVWHPSPFARVLRGIGNTVRGIVGGRVGQRDERARAAGASRAAHASVGAVAHR